MSDLDPRRGNVSITQDSAADGKAQPLNTTIDRRNALKGLGALALTAPALGSTFGCSDDRTNSDAGVSGSGSESTGTAAGSGTDASAGPGSADGSSSTTRGATGPGDEESTSVDTDEDTGSSDSTGEELPNDTDFDDVAVCQLTRTDIEGPFRIDEDEVPNDPTLHRVDLRDPGHEGLEFRLHFRVLDADADCAPIPGLKIYIWHTDALGFYSGFNDQNPNQQYFGAGARVPDNNDRFCRGYQVTDADGIVHFTSIFPGWYEGRPVHVHVIAVPDDEPFMLVNGHAPPAVFTTQLYFDLSFCEEIMANEAPYNTRPWPPTSTSRTEPRPGDAIPTITRDSSGNVIGFLNIIIRQ